MDFDPISLRRQLSSDVVDRFADVSAVMVHVAADPELRESLTEHYRFLATASVEARRRIFEDPRTSLALLAAEGAILNSTQASISSESQQSWARHAALMALGAALIDRRRYQVSFREPVIGSVVLPGAQCVITVDAGRAVTRMVLDADGHFGFEPGSAIYASIPTYGGFQLVTSEVWLAPPNLLETVAPINDEVDRPKWAKLLEDSSRVVAADATALALARQFGSIIVPVQGTSENIHSSVSFSNRPGILYMSWAPRVSVIAEAIVHESDHQLFYVVSRGSVLWEELVDGQPAIFRSPWRDDPRPLDGLLRGASAFTRVAEFWRRVSLSGQDSDEYPNWTNRRAVLGAVQSLDAVSLINRHGRLASSGKDLVDHIETRAQTLLSSMSLDPSFPDWRASALAQQQRHAAAWRSRNGSIEGDRATAIRPA